MGALSSRVDIRPLLCIPGHPRGFTDPLYQQPLGPLLQYGGDWVSQSLPPTLAPIFRAPISWQDLGRHWEWNVNKNSSSSPKTHYLVNEVSVKTNHYRSAPGFITGRGQKLKLPEEVRKVFPEDFHCLSHQYQFCFVSIVCLNRL